MRRGLLVGLGVVVLIAAGAGGGVYYAFFYTPTPDEVPPPEFRDNTATRLPTADEFAELARTDPVAMLAAGLSRYEREVKGGFRAVLDKQERVHGKLQEPELVDLFVRDTPAAVLMKWRTGGPSGTAATLFVEGENADQIRTWRPKVLVLKEMSIPLKGTLARGSSRYCMKDSGLFRGSLRTKTVWEAVQREGKLHCEYLGLRPVEKAGGRVCHVIRRTCEPEADGFALDEANPTDPQVIAREGFNEILLMVDAERWLQVGTELHRRGNGADELIGSYYFRDIELNPTFPENLFTAAGMKAK